MSGNRARSILLAAAIACGLCACVTSNTTAPVIERGVASVPAIQYQRAATADQAVQANRPQPKQVTAETANTPIIEAVTSPVVTASLSPVRIALLLPRRSESLAQVSDAVRAGFMAAYQYDPANIVVNFIETGDAAQDVLSGYQEAALRNDIVVGPLTRSGAAAIVQNHAIVKPTIALTQLNAAGDAEMIVPSNLLVMGLSIEDEARQVAGWASERKPAGKAFVIATNIAWQRRAASAFAAEWRHRGLQLESMQLGLTGGYLNASALAQLRKRLQAENPALIFVALDAAQTTQLRSAIGGEVVIYGTSQLNPLTLADWTNANPLPDLEDVRLIDMPWQLQPDHAAVMAYPHLAEISGQLRSPDVERLYALGIDAYRVAHNIAIHQNNFQLDGATGKLSVRFGNGPSHFERVEQPAIYREGKVQALDGP